MKRITLLLSIGLAAVSASAVEAADWNNGAGGLKAHGGLAGVPVPAPAPVVESFNWYVRADLGFAFKSSGTATVDTFFGLHEVHNYDRNEGPFFGGVGFGSYLTPKLRWDITGDYRGAQKIKSGQSIYIGTTTTVSTTGAVLRNYWDVTRSEEVRIANHQFLLNGYYDFNRGGGFNPYLGVGVGITAREGRTEFSEQGICTMSQDLSTGAFQGCAEPDYDKAGKPSNMNFGLAAALMAGVSYEFKEGVLLDTGYRLSWQGGNTTIRSPVSGDSARAGERIDHEIRAGLRWNVW